MKKGMSILLVILMLLVSTNSVAAAGDSLDIEKVAIQSIKNSQIVQTTNRQVALAQKNYADAKATVNFLRGTLPYRNSYQTVEQIILLPLELENVVAQANNGQQVVTNYVRYTSYKAYIDLLKANYALNIQQGLMNGLDADYRKSKLQQTLGMISQSQLRLSEIDYLKSQYRYNSAQKGFNSVSISVNNLMGEDLSKQYSTLLDNNITPAAQMKPLDDYVKRALANRSEVINAQNTVDIKKKEYELGKAEIPTDFQFYIQQQEYAIENAQNDLELAKINVQLDITNLYTALGNTMKTMEAMKALNDQAVLNYQAAEIEYQNSLMSLQEFDKAKVAKAQADINYKNAQFDAWLMQSTMDSACGIGYVPPNNASMSSSLSQPKSKNKPNPRERDN